MIHGNSLLDGTGPRPRGARIIRLPLWVLADLLRLDGTKCLRITGLPADARIVATSPALFFDTEEIALKVESAEWEPESPEFHIPQLDIAIEAFDPFYAQREWLEKCRPKTGA